MSESETPTNPVDPFADLSPRFRLFAERYVIHLSGTRAAVEAGYSKDNAGDQASRNLANPRVKAYVEHLLAEKRERNKITADRLLQELALLAFSDIGECFHDQAHREPDAQGNVTWGWLKKPHEMPESARRAVASLEYGDTDKVKMLDKTGAIQLAMKHLGMLKEKVEVSADKTFADLVLASMKGDK